MVIPKINPQDQIEREFVRPHLQYCLCKVLNEDTAGIIQSFLPHHNALWSFKFKFSLSNRDRHIRLQIELKNYFKNLFSKGELNLLCISTLDALNIVSDLSNFISILYENRHSLQLFFFGHFLKFYIFQIVLSNPK
jgi:hypothetical protein